MPLLLSLPMASNVQALARTDVRIENYQSSHIDICMKVPGSWKRISSLSPSSARILRNLVIGSELKAAATGQCESSNVISKFTVSAPSQGKGMVIFPVR